MNPNIASIEHLETDGKSEKSIHIVIEGLEDR